MSNFVWRKTKIFLCVAASQFVSNPCTKIYAKMSANYAEPDVTLSNESLQCFTARMHEGLLFLQ